MPNYKMVIEFDGTKFHGWQFQPGMRTVQGEIEKAIHKIFNINLRITAAGRTDSGVHARGMVANFKLETGYNLHRLLLALNSVTGRDIVIRKLEIAHDEFNSRWDATAREYLYRIAREFVALDRNQVYIFRRELDFSAMQEAVKCLVGSHNFSAFSLFNPKEKHYLCRVEFAEWNQVGNEYQFHIKANRFLHGMVRILVGTCLEVGKGALSPSQFKEILESRDRGRVGFKVPANGLCLLQVYY